jgi:hypothetical protein
MESWFYLVINSVLGLTRVSSDMVVSAKEAQKRRYEYEDCTISRKCGSFEVRLPHRKT